MTKGEIADSAALFREGARRIYEGVRPAAGEGDMWLFELFHFLGDVQERLGPVPRSEAALTKEPVIV